MILTKEQVLEQCKQAVVASNANGLQVLALIAGVIRQVAPSASVALPETSPVAPSSVAEPAVELTKAAPVESVEPPVAVPETASVAEPAVELPETSPVESESPVELPEKEPAVAPSSPTYRLVLNVPEIGLKGFAD